jgi:regulator of RNase E activity RraB
MEFEKCNRDVTPTNPGASVIVYKSAFFVESEARPMGFLDLFRSKQKTDLDPTVLVQLRKSGSDLSKPHQIEFFLYFPTRAVAEKASLDIRDAGFEVEVRAAGQGDSWLCFAKKTMIPSLANLQGIRQNFMALAGSMNGEYDGWGTQVVK